MFVEVTNRHSLINHFSYLLDKTFPPNNPLILCVLLWYAGGNYVGGMMVHFPHERLSQEHLKWKEESECSLLWTKDIWINASILCWNMMANTYSRPEVLSYCNECDVFQKSLLFNAVMRCEWTELLYIQNKWKSQVVFWW